ncbi:DNA-directed RNA polymerase II subunit RPB1-like [Eriocheir sinensis]|uniref:DNA-directed RNA polymerase II subunit RPB1-like n=1 Tax=Eriocheir sinensis TaxID=95602 RepID=UPI0021C9B55D|nr:DNA-directed RNA polymerase II subunit RPB1-like [Eriocheir sinensis]
MTAKVCFLLGLVVLVGADKRPQPAYSYSAPQDFSEESYESTEAKYEFNYAVKDEYSGNDFGHQESRDGDRTDGSYYVLLPDGRLQRVTYYVDGDSGFVAEVSYEGEARKPESYSPPKPTYAPPQPTYAPPRPTYTTPKPPRPTYAPPQPTYSPPRPTYTTPKPPRPTYAPPQPTYAPPQQTYAPPQPTYAPPRPTYAPPQPVYAPPQPTYSTPQRTYGFPQ